MRSMRFGLLIVLLTVGAGVTAMAQDRDTTKQELMNFDRFLDSHPAIDKDLSKNPALANNASYVSSHPELKQFLTSHPGVREEIRENPRAFMRGERRLEKSGADINRTEVRNLDGFLDKHPAIDRDLTKHPELANNAEYLAKHPEFRDFLDKHPGVRQEISEHPNVMMKRERKFDKKESKEAREKKAAKRAGAGSFRNRFH